MANSVTARFNDDCKVFVSMSDDTTVEKAVIIDAEGNETDIGGGGSSDFSIAEVTLINNDIHDVQGTGFACYEENEMGEGSPVMLLNMVAVPAGEQITVKVPMYKGTAYWNNPFSSAGTEAPTTGDIVNESGNFTITGDGTITFSASE